MPTKIRIVHAHEFLRATEDGRLDLEASRRLLRDILAASAAWGDHAVILDTRKAQSEMSTFDLWSIARELAEHGDLLKMKKAVLCPLTRFDRAEFFALCAQDRGLLLRAFTSYEDAMEWLLEDEAAPGR